MSRSESSGLVVGSLLISHDREPVTARFSLSSTELEIRWRSDLGPEVVRRVQLTDVVEGDEVGPVGADPARLEVKLLGGEVIALEVPRSFLQAIEEARRAAAGTTGLGGTGASVAGLKGRPYRPTIAAVALIAIIASVGWQAVPSHRAEPTEKLTGRARAERPVEAPALGAALGEPLPAPSAAGVVHPVQMPAEAGLAPLTGLQLPAGWLPRAAIVSKIDASPQAMPQVGMELADVVYEVKIEWGSRYIAVWHSQEPEVVGPLRSARTTDPDLLAMFGHPLFAFSGANDGVVRRLADTTWKTAVGPMEVGDAYFRDENRPYPNNLFARSAGLRSVASPPVWPTPIFDFHPPGASPGGMPVQRFTSSPGVDVEFSWDAGLGGWRRRIWGEEHLHASGAAVAPTNVVVVETAYRQSDADARSPEAISVGSARAWVFTGGTVRQGSWTRQDRNDRWNLRHPDGTPITLEPGTTWVVLAEGEPRIG